MKKLIIALAAVVAISQTSANVSPDDDFPDDILHEEIKRMVSRDISTEEKKSIEYSMKMNKLEYFIRREKNNLPKILDLFCREEYSTGTKGYKECRDSIPYFYNSFDSLTKKELGIN